MISVVVISPDDSEGVVLAEVMEAAKEIRSGDKKRVKSGVKTPIVRRSGWRPGGCWAVGGWSGLSGCLGGNEGVRRRGDGLPGAAGTGNDPAAIRRYLISH